MSAAERANVKTATVARTSSGKALVTQVRGGAIIGLSITSLILIGIPLLYFLFGADPTNKELVSQPYLPRAVGNFLNLAFCTTLALGEGVS